MRRLETLKFFLYKVYLPASATEIVFLLNSPDKQSSRLIDGCWLFADPSSSELLLCLSIFRNLQLRSQLLQLSQDETEEEQIVGVHYC